MCATILWMNPESMELLVNGKPRSAKAGCTIGHLVLEMGVAGPGVAVAVNDSVVRSDDFETVRLKPGDRVEIIHAVGGG
jgi:thiamine biosynthesis protein ThiS